MNILFQNDDWLVINKPTGISAQATYDGDMAIPVWLSLYHGEKVHVFSQLDKGASGVMVMARNPEAATRGQKVNSFGKSEKTYVFLSSSDSLKTGKGKSWVVKTAISGKPAHTSFERMGVSGKYFRYKATVLTGRVHQVRRHAKETKVSILGDEKYGGARFPRLCLHCQSVTWPDIKEKLVAPLPSSMGSLGDFASDPGFLVSFDRRLKFFDGITNAFRCVHRGEMAALDASIDFYGGWLCIWIYDEVTPIEEIEELLKPYIKKLSAAYNARGCVLKRNLKNPHERGLIKEQKIIGDEPPAYFDVEEHGIKYKVSLTEGQHVGLFLDQRDNRLRVRALAAGRRVANLFSYTCSFSLMAASSLAAEVVSVDSAKPCLETGKAGFTANGFDNISAQFHKDDVRDWLKRQMRKEDKKFDVIICDPPTFSSTKSGGKFSAEKEWEFLAQSCHNIGFAHGDFLFCTNHRKGNKEHYKRVLEKTFKSVVETPAPIDFPAIQNKDEHVKIFWCRK